MSSVMEATHSKRQTEKKPAETWACQELTVPAYFTKKVLWMRLLGACLLVLFSPLILLCMLLVKLTSAGPALLRQTRLGKDDQPFEILKIRSMYRNAEHLAGPVLCQPRDSRITPVGKVLRFLHLDELPQLINVARGEMCLIGPRPERPEIIEKHQLLEKVPGFAERTKVLPGVTGLAQINLSADVSAECVIPKVKLDREYITTANMWLDLRILLCTFLRMAGIRHGHAAKFFHLNRSVELGQASKWILGNGCEEETSSNVHGRKVLSYAFATADEDNLGADLNSEKLLKRSRPERNDSPISLPRYPR
ncbi:sugar transferase [Bythopirellula goksoeyrii]|uniref:UDP-N-acetylgalactosamine-undecaprenyl-phosphate N-acetylgalactosaminephosphotransferase n=1 Tax=Bythopirellula goksoeyrii TaxID=1400387 RepID=A0A5B9QAN0_9BACT|nr:sugar transferase [Bythopirellula goksoeyrii]QEG36047.1 UDP-N-acetylgalactosamine-undecaprenyl-phosphate N-acetylgalactosaminephosphotransferase [Bythopirellula goksoeyrii]